MFCSVAICIPHGAQAVSEVSAEAFEPDFQAVNLQTRCLLSLEMFHLTCELFVHLVFFTQVEYFKKYALFFSLKPFYF